MHDAFQSHRQSSVVTLLIHLSSDIGLIKVCIPLLQLRWIKFATKISCHSQYPAQQADRVMAAVITGAK